MARPVSVIKRSAKLIKKRQLIVTENAGGLMTNEVDGEIESDHSDDSTNQRSKEDSREMKGVKMIRF